MIRYITLVCNFGGLMDHIAINCNLNLVICLAISECANPSLRNVLNLHFDL